MPLPSAEKWLEEREKEEKERQEQGLGRPVAALAKELMDRHLGQSLAKEACTACTPLLVGYKRGGEEVIIRS